MQKFKTLADAIALAEYAHRNQVDRAGLPYIDHPKRVLAAVQAQGVLPYVQMAAVLHDVTEDTAFTPDILLELGVPESAVEVIRLLDRNVSAEAFANVLLAKGPDVYAAVWGDSGAQAKIDQAYYESIRANPAAVKIKRADISDNTQPWRLAYLSDETQARLRAKYDKALDVLGGINW